MTFVKGNKIGKQFRVKKGLEKEKHPAWKGGNIRRRENYFRDYLRRERKIAIEILGSKCIKCGFSDEIDINFFVQTVTG